MLYPSVPIFHSLQAKMQVIFTCLFSLIYSLFYLFSYCCFFSSKRVFILLAVPAMDTVRSEMQFRCSAYFYNMSQDSEEALASNKVSWFKPLICLHSDRIFACTCSANQDKPTLQDFF